MRNKEFKKIIKSIDQARKIHSGKIKSKISIFDKEMENPKFKALYEKISAKG